MIVTVETYQDRALGPALDPSRRYDAATEEFNVIHREQTLALSTAAGLQVLAAQLRGRVTVNYPQMTAKEERVWRTFLPTTYTIFTDGSARNPRGQDERLIPLSSYTFDTPPVSVLEILKAEHDAKRFVRLDIWTPEVIQWTPFDRAQTIQVRQRDPILVGYVASDPRPYLLARWGESLQDFRAIRRSLPWVRYKRLWKTNRDQAIPIAIIVGCVLILLSIGLWALILS
jgi:hypothetical protein